MADQLIGIGPTWLSTWPARQANRRRSPRGATHGPQQRPKQDSEEPAI